MTRAGKCQGIHDRLTEIALEFADAGEQALFPWNSLCSVLSGDGGRADVVCVCANLSKRYSLEKLGVPRYLEGSLRIGFPLVKSGGYAIIPWSSGGLQGLG